MKGDDNNSIARISLYNLYHNRSDSHWYIIIPNNYSVNDDNKRKLIYIII